MLYWFFTTPNEYIVSRQPLVLITAIAIFKAECSYLSVGLPSQACSLFIKLNEVLDEMLCFRYTRSILVRRAQRLCKRTWKSYPNLMAYWFYFAKRVHCKPTTPCAYHWHSDFQSRVQIIKWGSARSGKQLFCLWNWMRFYMRCFVSGTHGSAIDDKGLPASAYVLRSYM